MRHNMLFLLLFILLMAACSSSGTSVADGDTEQESPDSDDALDGDTDGDADTEDSDREDEDAEEPAQDGDEEDTPDGDTEEEWVFDRSEYPVVKGWILLDSDPDSVSDTIAVAARYGVNHIQLSHDLIMNIDDVLGDTPNVNVDTLNLGIQLAHEQGMKAYVWVHEFSPTTLVVCYDPEDAIWERRANAYREALTLMPDLDGVIFMFGSAPTPPWYTMCSCDWCSENYEGTAFEVPPQGERLRIVLDKIGGVIVNELGLEMFVRTFVHEPAEVDFHRDGLMASRGVPFIGMHKGPVQDWQPYNPHHPNIGNIGPRPGIVELDAAGEYWGQSILPMAAPGYFRYRYLYAYENRGVGAVLRVQRGSRHAIGTPNEVNILAMNMLLDDPTTPLDAIWETFIKTVYGIEPESVAYPVLQRILDDTFPIRLKSHYVLGIWAFEKSSSFPRKARYDQFTDRGEMPKWNPIWQPRWEALNTPNPSVVRWTWQEGSEAVELSQSALDDLATLEAALNASNFADLATRLRHQFHAARAWRAMKTWIVARRVLNRAPEDTALPGLMRWLLADLETIRQDMVDAELSSVGVAGPGEITEFLSNALPLTPDAEPVEPPIAAISAVRVESLTSDTATLRFTIRRPGHVWIDYGTEIPTYGESLDLGEREGNTEITATIETLPKSTRVVFRVRVEAEGDEFLSGDGWLFPPEAH